MCCQPHQFFFRRHGLGAPRGWARAHWYRPSNHLVQAKYPRAQGLCHQCHDLCQTGSHPAIHFKGFFFMDQVCSVIFLSLCNVPCQRRARLTLKSYTSFSAFHLERRHNWFLTFQMSSWKGWEKRVMSSKSISNMGMLIWMVFGVWGVYFISKSMVSKY